MPDLIRISRRAAMPLAIVLIATAIAAPPASAQALYGAIVGTVDDPSGAPVPGVNVTATNTGTGLKVDAQTDADGSYTFRNLQPGTYDLHASLSGFRELKRTGIRVAAGNPVRQDLKLEVGTVAEAVTVTAETTLLQTEKADLHTELTSKEVVNLPLNQFRNYQALLNLVPGATPAQLQNAEIDTPGRALSTSVNGVARNVNSFRVDGAVSVNVWLPHHVGYVQSAETIEVVNVATNNYDADQGMAGGAAVTVLTKSGTNQFHGSGFFLRNQDELNANTFVNNANGLARPQQSTGIYGGTLGGPIVHNKLFFFGGWERYAARRGSQTAYSVPSLKMRAGDFSEVAAVNPGFRLFNPFTGGAGGVGREQFPNNTIPSNLISPIWQRALQYYPNPNAADVNRNGIADDFVQPRTVRNDRDNFDSKLTFQRTSSHNIWAKFSMLRAKVVDNFSIGFDEGSLGDTKIYVGGIGHTWTLSPSLVLDGNIGINRQDQSVTGPDFGQNLGLDVFGIPGTNGPSERYSGLPTFDIFANNNASWPSTTQIYDLGTTPSWMPLFRHERSYTFSQALTWVKGRHQVRTGIDVVRHELNHFQAEFGNYGLKGGFQFGGSVTGAAGYNSTVWNELGAFVLGRASFYGKDVQEIEMTGREWQLGYFIADHWNASDKLTFNLGLRLERYPLMKRRDSGIERLDYNTFTVLLGGRGDVPEDAGIKVKSLYFAPRIGAIYRATNDTVFRGGYGITYNPLPWSRPMRGSFPYDIFLNQTAEQFSSFPVAAGIPAVPTPDLSTGRAKLPQGVFMRSPNPNDVNRGRIQQMNLAVEQRLPGDIALEVALVHTRTDGGYADLNVNYGEPGGGQASRQYFSVAGTTAINDWAARTKSRYKGLQLAVNRPFSNGLLLKGAYTLSQTKNMADEDGWTNVGNAGSNWNHPLKYDDNYGLATYDRTHVAQLGWVYELPFAKNSKNPLAAIVKNWQVNGIAAWYSGTPFSIGGSNTALNCPACGDVLINVQGDPKPTGTAGSADVPWYDKSLFSQPTSLGKDGFGTSRRNQFRTPSIWNVDMGLFRSFPMGRFRPEIRIEAQNVFNHTNWGRPNTTFTSPLFLTFQPGAAHQFSTIWGTGTTERVVRVGLRLEF
jgi:hypothetical protein